MYVFESFRTCRAAERRLQTGSDNPYEKTAASSTEAAIAPANKGFKMLAKMGWSQGQGLGSEGNQGRTEPVPMTTNVERAGILHTVTFIGFFVFSVQEGVRMIHCLASVTAWLGKMSPRLGSKASKP